MEKESDGTAHDEDNKVQKKRHSRVVRVPTEWMIQVVNVRTGEVMEGEAASGIPVVGRVRRRQWVNEFFLGMADGFEELATNQRLTHDARRVFLLMASQVKWEGTGDNYVMLSQREMSQKLGIDPPRVSRAVQLLVREAFISPRLKGSGESAQIERRGRTVVYELGAHVVWKGAMEHRRDYMKRWRQNRKRLATQKTAGSSCTHKLLP
jgi:hypothetical protein